MPFNDPQRDVPSTPKGTGRPEKAWRSLSFFVYNVRANQPAMQVSQKAKLMMMMMMNDAYMRFPTHSPRL